MANVIAREIPKNDSKHSLLKRIFKNLDIYLYISPFFIIFLAFTLYPILFSMFVSF
jgi:ABC-type sugar transport system permease subunit